MENKKLTKKDYYGMVREIVSNSEVENKEDLVAFVDKQIELLDSKAVKAKEAAATKKIKGDELRAAVENVLTDEYQTIDEIVSKVESEEEITKSKVIARLTQLVKTGLVEKESVKVEDRKVMAYRKVVSE